VRCEHLYCFYAGLLLILLMRGMSAVNRHRLVGDVGVEVNHLDMSTESGYLIAYLLFEPGEDETAMIMTASPRAMPMIANDVYGS